MPVSSDSMLVARNADFQNRVKYFLQKASIAVMAEAVITVGHTLRLVYAGKVLAGTASESEATIAVLTNGTIATAGFNATDNDLEFVVNSLFNALAGVSL